MSRSGGAAAVNAVSIRRRANGQLQVPAYQLAHLTDAGDLGGARGPGRALERTCLGGVELAVGQHHEVGVSHLGHGATWWS